MRKSLGYLALALLASFLGAAAVILYTPLGERPLTAVFPAGKPAPIDFATLRAGDRPNRYLICPPDHCGASAHAVSPVFDMPVDHLRERWRQVVAAQPRVRVLREYENGMQIDYVQRSARFRFPDIVTVRFLSVPPSQSTLAIYSRSLYGRDDFGVNRRRVEAWLAQLQRSS